MPNQIDVLRLRKTFGRTDWTPPTPYGPQGWRLDRRDGSSSILVSHSDHPDWPGVEWVHASIAHTDHMPSYAELQQLHRGAFNGYAYQAFVPRSQHVNHHPWALHLWGRLDGLPCIPDFSAFVTMGGQQQRMV